MSQMYGVGDLATAQINAVRFADKHPDLASFHVRRFEAFAAAFGVDQRFELEHFGGSEIEGLAASTIDTIVGLYSPFSSYLEASGDVVAFHREFGAAINAGIRQTTDALTLLLVALLTSMYGIPADRSISTNDLCAAGFDPEEEWPDELDYL